MPHAGVMVDHPQIMRMKRCHASFYISIPPPVQKYHEELVAPIYSAGIMAGSLGSPAKILVVGRGRCKLWDARVFNSPDTGVKSCLELGTGRKQ